MPGPALGVAAWLALGCASGLLVLEQGFANPLRGYRIQAPPGAGWVRTELPGADLAFARGSATMSLQSTCDRPLADPAILARHLLFGLGAREAVAGGPVQLGGLAGWSQTFATRAPGRAEPVRGRTVTLVSAPCTFDWILVAGEGFAEAEPAFDAWWRSFEREAPS